MEKAKILIVEDETIIAMEIENQLQSLGYEVISIVDTGEKAIEKAEKEKPDLILMDIRIKGEMDGIDTAKEIRNRFRIPVIFSTAYLDEARISRAKITVPFGYILKPIQERDFRVTIEMALYVAKVDAERKQMEDLLRFQRNLGIALGTALDFHEMLQLCMRAALEVSNMDCGGIYIVDTATSSLSLAYHEGLSEDFVATVSHYNADSPNTQMVMNGNPAYASYDQLGVVLTKIDQNENLKSMAIIPVEHDNRIIGCLNVASHNLEEIPRFVRNTLETIVTQIGDAIVKKQVEDDLKKSESQRKAWLENSPTCTKILDLDFNLQYMSDAGVRGLKIDDIAPYYGKPYPFEFFPVSFKNPMRNNLAIAKETGKTITQEAPVVDVEGNEIWFHSTIIPVNDNKGRLDYIMVVSVETTKRKQIEISLKKERDSNASILRWIDSIVVVIDLDGNVIKFNKAAERCSGYSLEEIREKPFWDILISQRERQTVKGVILNVKTELLQKENENYWMNKKGQKRLIHWHNSILEGPDNKIEYILCTGIDITKRKEMEDTLKKSHNELEQKVVERTAALQQEIDERKQIEHDLLESRKEAEFANSAKSDFLSNLSHEFRTPMHQILSYSKFGVDKINNVKKEKLLHYFSKIGIIGKNLLSLLNDLLDLSKLESGKLDYDMRKNDLKQIISNVAQEFVALVNEKSLRIEIVENNIKTAVICDEHKISQVVRNLVSNAVKFTQKGKKIIVSIEENQLSNETTPFLQINVFDEGTGIPSDELESIFDKFVQSSKTKTNAGGTGLGLAICKEIIMAHNGNIWAENNPEGGATLSFILPYEKVLT